MDLDILNKTIQEVDDASQRLLFEVYAGHFIDKINEEVIKAGNVSRGIVKHHLDETKQSCICVASPKCCNYTFGTSDFFKMVEMLEENLDGIKEKALEVSVRIAKNRDSYKSIMEEYLCQLKLLVLSPEGHPLIKDANGLTLNYLQTDNEAADQVIINYNDITLLNFNVKTTGIDETPEEVKKRLVDYSDEMIKESVKAVLKMQAEEAEKKAKARVKEEIIPLLKKLGKLIEPSWNNSLKLIYVEYASVLCRRKGMTYEYELPMKLLTDEEFYAETLASLKEEVHQKCVVEKLEEYLKRVDKQIKFKIVDDLPEGKMYDLETGKVSIKFKTYNIALCEKFTHDVKQAILKFQYYQIMKSLLGDYPETICLPGKMEFWKIEKRLIDDAVYTAFEIRYGNKKNILVFKNGIRMGKRSKYKALKKMGICRKHVICT